MAIKNLFLTLSGDSAGPNVARWAMEYAKRTGAHLSVGYDDGLTPAHFGADAAPIAAYGLFYQHMEKLREDCIRLARDQFDSVVAETKMPIVTVPGCTRGSTEWLDDDATSGSIEKRSLLADLSLVAAPGNRTSPGTWALIDEVLFQRGTPALIVPASVGSSFFARPLIAWNGSSEAAKAVRQSLEVLKLASEITIAQVGAPRAGSIPVKDLVTYLGWQCLAVPVTEVLGLPEKSDGVVLEQAHKRGADGIIMGAYTHTRTRELLFGGVTDFMLRHSDLPMIMAH